MIAITLNFIHFFLFTFSKLQFLKWRHFQTHPGLFKHKPVRKFSHKKVSFENFCFSVRFSFLALLSGFKNRPDSAELSLCSIDWVNFHSDALKIIKPRLFECSLSALGDSSMGRRTHEKKTETMEKYGDELKRSTRFQKARRFFEEKLIK